MARVEGRIDTVLKEIKSLIQAMTFQNNEIMRKMTKQEGGVNKGFFISNPARILDDVEELKKLKQTGP